jgi:hypothetical protein
MAAMRRRQEREKRKLMGGPVEREKVVRDVRVPDAITVQELANRMAERVTDVIKSLMKMDIMATQNQSIDPDTAEERHRNRQGRGRRPADPRACRHHHGSCRSRQDLAAGRPA